VRERGICRRAARRDHRRQAVPASYFSSRAAALGTLRPNAVVAPEMAAHHHHQRRTRRGFAMLYREQRHAEGEVLLERERWFEVLLRGARRFGDLVAHASAGDASDSARTQREIERSGLSARGRCSSEKADTARPKSSPHAARYGTRGHARSTRSARNER